MTDISKLIQDYVPQGAQEVADKALILRYLELFDNLLSRDNPFAHFTSSALIVNPSRTKTLFIHHKIYQTWGWTGGHADGDGDLLGVALKEAREETGLQEFKVLNPEIGSLDIIPVSGHYKHGQWVSSHQHLSVAYLLEADDRAPLIQNQVETNGVKWFPLAEIAAASQEAGVIPVYEKLLARLGSEEDPSFKEQNNL